VLKSHLRASRFQNFLPFGRFAPFTESPVASYFSKIAPYSDPYWQPCPLWTGYFSCPTMCTNIIFSNANFRDKHSIHSMYWCTFWKCTVLWVLWPPFFLGRPKNPSLISPGMIEESGSQGKKRKIISWFFSTTDDLTDIWRAKVVNKSLPYLVWDSSAPCFPYSAVWHAAFSRLQRKQFIMK
jgi:hypothetical protein